MGFEIVVDESQAKYKLNQNSSLIDQRRVQQVLQASPFDIAHAVAKLMQTFKFKE